MVFYEMVFYVLYELWKFYEIKNLLKFRVYFESNMNSIVFIDNSN